MAKSSAIPADLCVACWHTKVNSLSSCRSIVVMASIIDEKKKGFSLGAADYLSKPVERDRLIGSIGKLLGSKPGKVIMIVEDNEDLRLL